VTRDAAHEDEAGSATVLVIAWCVVLLATTSVLVLLAALLVTRHEAESAADLAALSAARHALEGNEAACRVARATAERHGARLDTCGLADLDVVVRVSIAPPGRLARFARVIGTARAGAR
jgi:secretion/DNA translocation related TadE-like protein